MNKLFSKWKKRRKLKQWFRQSIAFLLSFTMLFLAVPATSWQSFIHSVAIAADSTTITNSTTNTGAPLDDLQKLLQQTMTWNEASVVDHNPTVHEATELQVIEKMPDLKVDSSGSNDYLQIDPPTADLFISKDQTSLTVQWEDYLQDWINQQDGDPQSPPNGYKVAVYVKDVKSKKAYQIRSYQEDQQGSNSFTWDGNDLSNNKIPDGMYEWYLKAIDPTVDFQTADPAGSDLPPVDNSLTAPDYAAEYTQVTVDRTPPKILAIHNLGNGYLGIDVMDDVSGIHTITANGNATKVDKQPLHVILPMTNDAQVQLSLTVEDTAGNQISDELKKFPAGDKLPNLWHTGDTSYIPHTSGQVAGHAATIDLYTGNGFMRMNGFSQSGIGPSINVSMAYNSQNLHKGMLGYGWTLSLDSQLTFWEDKDVTWTASNGAVFRFHPNGTGYTTYVEGQQQAYPQLSKDSEGQYVLTDSDWSTHTFSKEGRILSQADRDGNQLTYQYKETKQYNHSMYQLESVSNASNRKITIQYQDDPKQITITGPAPASSGNRSVVFELDKDGNVASFTDVMHRKTVFSYTNHRLDSMTDSNQVVTSINYDTNDRATFIHTTRRQDQVSEFVGAHYNDNGSAYLLNPLNTDIAGIDLSNPPIPADNFVMGWDIQGRMNKTKQDVQMEDPASNNHGTITTSVITNRKYEANRLVKTDQPHPFDQDAGNWATDSYGKTEFQYDSSDRVTDKLMSSGGVMHYEYNGNNDVTLITGPYGYKMTYQYQYDGKKQTESSEMKDVSDPLNRDTSYQITTKKTYANNGLLNQEQITDSRQSGKSVTISYQYDADGNPTTSSDSNYTYAYFPDGSVHTETWYQGAVNATTTYIYNDLGQQKRVEHPNGLIEEWTRDYNADHQWVATHVQYDKNTPDKKMTTTNVYDDGYHLMKSTSNTTITSYTVDGMGNNTKEAMLPVGDTQDQPRTNEYHYDNRGLVEEQKDYTGLITTYLYNAAGQTTKQIAAPETSSYTEEPSEIVHASEYNDNGQLTASVMPDGSKTEYQYDLMGRKAITQQVRTINVPQDSPIQWSNPPKETLTTEAYHDAFGQLLENKDPAGNWTRYTYDYAGNTATESKGGPIPHWNQDALPSSSGKPDTIYPDNEVLTTRSYAYDVQGRLVTETDGLGYTTEYQYNAGSSSDYVYPAEIKTKKYPAFQTAADGSNQLVYYYEKTVNDPMHNVKASITPDGYKTTSYYDVFGKINKVVNAEGGTKQYVYDKQQRLLETVDDVDLKEGTKQRVWYHYAPWGQQDQIISQLKDKGVTFGTDEHGYPIIPLSESNDFATTTNQYDKIGRLQSSIDAAGLKTENHYDDYGRPYEKDAKNVTTNQWGMKITKTIKTVTHYDIMGRTTHITWPGVNGTTTNSTTYKLYDSTGQAAAELDPEGYLSTFKYNKDGFLTETQKLGKTADANAAPLGLAKLVYDAKGNIVAKQNPVNQQIQEPFQNGVLTQHVKLKLYQYNTEGHLVTEKSLDMSNASSIQDVTSTDSIITQHYQYDPRGLQISYTNGRDKATQYAYNKQGLLQEKIDPSNITTAYEYTPLGNVKTIIRPLGRNIVRQYNNQGQKTFEADGEGHYFVLHYDAGGRKDWETNKSGDIVRYSYNPAGRMTSKNVPSEGTYTYAYDAVGNQTQMTKPVYGTTFYQYDDRNNLLKVNEPGDNTRHITSYLYDNNGNRVKQTDPNNQTTVYAYNYAGHKTAETMYLNGQAYTFSYAYYPSGQLKWETKPGGQTISYQYDFLNRVTYESHSDGNFIAYTYNKDNTIHSQTTPDGTTSYTYWDNGQVKSVSSPNGDVIAYQYDESGDLQNETVNGKQIKVDFRDKSGLTKTYTDIKGFTYNFNYDSDGFIQDRSFPNKVKTHYDYLPEHLLNNVKTTGPNGENIYTSNYTQQGYNKRGFVIKLDENGRTFGYHYNDREELDQVITPAGDKLVYTYDPAGNRLSRGAIVGDSTLDPKTAKTLTADDLITMVMDAIKGAGDSTGSTDQGGTSPSNKAHTNNGHGKNQDVTIQSASSKGKGPGNSQGNGNGTPSSGGSKPSSGGSQGNGSGNGNGNGNSNGNGSGKPKVKGPANALLHGKGKKYGLYKKYFGSGDKITGLQANVLAVVDNIVNGETNLPPGDHQDLFDLVREVGKGYIVTGTTWTYDARNEVQYKENLVRHEGYDFAYDAAGSLTSNGREGIEWNTKGQMKKITFPDGAGQRYQYDGMGRRTKVIQFNHQGETQWEINYHYRGNTWQISNETDESGKEIMSFTYDEDGLPLSITFQGNTYWYVYNGHGDVVALTDKDGKVAARYEYNAWGLTTKMFNQSGDRVREGIGWIGDLGTGNGTPGSINGPTQNNTNYDLHPGNGNGQAKGWNKQTQGAVKIQSADSTTTTSDTQAGTNTTSVESTSTTDTTTTDITTELVKQNPYRYAHYYWDRKTQYYYLHARYYNPRDGRFLSLDTIEGQITNPLSLNRYLYTTNNPVNYSDPTGHKQVEAAGYVSSGIASTTPVVFLHGWTGSPDTWVGMINYIKELQLGYYAGNIKLSYKEGHANYWEWNNVNVEKPESLGVIKIETNATGTRNPLYTIQFANNSAGAFDQVHWLMYGLNRIGELQNIHQVALVAHSMGGIIGTLYIEDYTNPNVGLNHYSNTELNLPEIVKFVPIDSPINGSWESYLGDQAEIGEPGVKYLRPNSVTIEWVNAFKKFFDKNTQVLAIASVKPAYDPFTGAYRPGYGDGVVSKSSQLGFKNFVGISYYKERVFINPDISKITLKKTFGLLRENHTLAPGFQPIIERVVKYVWGVSK